MEYVTRLAMAPSAFPLPGYGDEDMQRLREQFVAIAVLDKSLPNRWDTGGYIFHFSLGFSPGFGTLHFYRGGWYFFVQLSKKNILKVVHVQ